LLVFLLLNAGCGYHTAGHVVQLPDNVKTIAVPAFKNETLTYRIEQMLTAWWFASLPPALTTAYSTTPAKTRTPPCVGPCFHDGFSAHL